jgi:hypothetical protein
VATAIARRENETDFQFAGRFAERRGICNCLRPPHLRRLRRAIHTFGTTFASISPCTAVMLFTRPDGISTVHLACSVQTSKPRQVETVMKGGRILLTLAVEGMAALLLWAFLLISPNAPTPPDAPATSQGGSRLAFVPPAAPSSAGATPATPSADAQEYDVTLRLEQASVALERALHHEVDRILAPLTSPQSRGTR